MGKPTYYFDIKQGTKEWFKIKSLTLSASNASTIKANGKGLETYVLELIAEHLSTAEPERYTNEHMERGNLLEEQARTCYEFNFDKTVEQVGFCKLDRFRGASPDGLVDNDGLIEIKCPSDKKFVELLIFEKIDTAYISQIQYQLMITGREWCDFFAYNPNIAPYYYCKRIERDKEAIEKIKEGCQRGEELIKDYLKRLNIES